MLFSSPVFLFLFLPLCIFAYYGTAKSNYVLLFFSLVFYTWGEPILVLAMLGTILFNFIFGLAIENCRSRAPAASKWLLWLGVSGNIALLIYYKYYNFVAHNINEVTSRWHGRQISEAKIPLLLGVSFFTFQAMSYLIDVYRKEYAAQRNVFKFALFKTFFPQLIAGPIARYSEVGAQLSARTHGWLVFADGIEQFAIGLGKKVLIADVCAVSVDKIFALPIGDLSGSVAWTGALLFTLQIYFDFSGYSDIALGLGKMFGFVLPVNFNHPYSALSIQDFWRRWHMTLSRWFRDYLYIPLGGNRSGPVRTALNLFIVFFLCGLWHGANVTFLAWGLWHGAFLALERTGFGSVLARLHLPLRRLYVLVVVVFSWVLFRSTSIAQFQGFSQAMLGMHGWENPQNLVRLFADNLTVLAAILGCLFSFPYDGRIRQLRDYAGSNPAFLILRKAAAATAPRIFATVFLLILSFAFLGAQTHRAFIYFRF
jgi:alginate O-acetyltransferase complex protein AlgI